MTTRRDGAMTRPMHVAAFTFAAVLATLLGWLVFRTAGDDGRTSVEPPSDAEIQRLLLDANLEPPTIDERREVSA